MNEDWLDVKLCAVTLIGLIFIWYQRRVFRSIRSRRKTVNSCQAMIWLHSHANILISSDGRPESSHEELHRIYDSIMGKTSAALLCITRMCVRSDCVGVVKS